jgi:hypothetical protein
VKVFDGNNATSASGGVRVATGDVNGDGATGASEGATLSARKTGGDPAAGAARIQSQNNLKQMGLANPCK